MDIFLHPMYNLSEVSAKRHCELSNIRYMLCAVVSEHFAAKGHGAGIILIMSQVSVVQWSVIVEQGT